MDAFRTEDESLLDLAIVEARVGLAEGGIPIGAVLVITFLLGWNQYLWPLMISIDNAHFPLMRGLNLTGAGSGASMVLASVSILPPVLLVLGFLRLMSRVTAIRI